MDPVPVPTLTECGLIVLSGMLLAVAAFVLRKRKRVAEE